MPKKTKPKSKRKGRNVEDVDMEMLAGMRGFRSASARETQDAQKPKKFE